MKLNQHEIQLLATAFLVLEEDMSYEQEEEIFRRSECSVGDLYELADKCKLVAPQPLTTHDPQSTPNRT